jgi:hypothetical protein
MKLQKIILCVAVALTSFGTSLGLLEIGSYLSSSVRAALQPLRVEIKPLEPFTPLTYAPERLPEFEQPVDTPVEKTRPEVWVESGYYLIIGDNPKGFANFDNIMFDMDEYDEKLGKVVADKPFGIFCNTDNVLNQFITRMNIKGKRLTLETDEQRGVSYQFDGKFIKEEVKAKYSDGSGEYTATAVLKGRLTKWRNGVKIAEAEVKFAYTMGC